MITVRVSYDGQTKTAGVGATMASWYAASPTGLSADPGRRDWESEWRAATWIRRSGTRLFV